MVEHETGGMADGGGSNQWVPGQPFSRANYDQIRANLPGDLHNQLFRPPARQSSSRLTLGGLSGGDSLIHCLPRAGLFGRCQSRVPLAVRV